MSSQEHERATGTRSVLGVADIHKRFGGVHALRGISLAFERGQIYHLLGENGCGKSTVIKIISGAQPPDRGRDSCIEGAAPSRAFADRGAGGGYRDRLSGPFAAAEHERGGERGADASTGRAAAAACADASTARALGRPASAALASGQACPTMRISSAPRCRATAARDAAARRHRARDRERGEVRHHGRADDVADAEGSRQSDRVVAQLRAEGVAVLFVTHKLDECYASAAMPSSFATARCWRRDRSTIIRRSSSAS